MIFDRTRQDVENAVRIRAQKVQNGLELSEQEVEILERGTLTINALNRIEQKQDYLKQVFNGMGYFNVGTLNKAWSAQDIFKGEDFKRITNNLDILKEAFFVYSNTPNTPEPTYYYETINSIEKILNDLDLMIYDVQSKYRFCGTFNCGESI